MALIEQSVIASIEVLHSGVLQVRREDQVLRDEQIISTTNHRHTLAPGDELAGEDERVVAVANAVWTQEVIAAWLVGQGTASIETQRTVAATRIRAHRDGLSARGGYSVTVAGVPKWFHSDPISKTQQLGLLRDADQVAVAGGDMDAPFAGPGPGGTLPWKTMDGTFVLMTGNVARGVYAAAKSQDAAIFQAAETHRAAMEAAADPLAYDYSQGWPATYTGG